MLSPKETAALISRNLGLALGNRIVTGIFNNGETEESTRARYASTVLRYCETHQVMDPNDLEEILAEFEHYILLAALT